MILKSHSLCRFNLESILGQTVGFPHHIFSSPCISSLDEMQGLKLVHMGRAVACPY